MWWQGHEPDEGHVAVALFLDRLEFDRPGLPDPEGEDDQRATDLSTLLQSLRGARMGRLLEARVVPARGRGLDALRHTCSGDTSYFQDLLLQTELLPVNDDFFLLKLSHLFCRFRRAERVPACRIRKLQWRPRWEVRFLLKNLYFLLKNLYLYI